MLISRRNLLAMAITCLGFLVITDASAQGIVAVVDGRAVQSKELDGLLGDKLVRLKSEEYAVRLTVLNGYVDQILLSREAERRSISLAELLRQQIDGQVSAVTEVEARAILDSSARANEQLVNDATVKAAMEDLKRRRLAKRRGEFLASLRQQYDAQIKLEAPTLSRPISGGTHTGAAEGRRSRRALFQFL